MFEVSKSDPRKFNIGSEDVCFKLLAFALESKPKVGVRMSIIAIEVKLSNTVDTKEARTLNWFAEEFSDYNISKCLINTGSHAYTRNDGVQALNRYFLKYRSTII